MDDLNWWWCSVPPAVDLEGWRERLSVERDTPTSAAVMVDDDGSGESDSEGEEPLAIGATQSKPNRLTGFPKVFRVTLFFFFIHSLPLLLFY